MELSSLEDLLVEELKDLYSAEKQLTKALPKMAKGANHEELKQAIQEHLTQTEEHVRRLEQCFEQLGQAPKAKKCQAMEGLIEEGAELLKQDADDDVKDAGIIAAAQKVEHYEIAGYGTVRAYAELLGHEDVVQLLQQTLDEEKETNEKLNDLAMSTINVEASSEEGEFGEEGEMAGAGGSSSSRWAAGEREGSQGQSRRTSGGQSGSRSSSSSRGGQSSRSSSGSSRSRSSSGGTKGSRSGRR